MIKYVTVLLYVQTDTYVKNSQVWWRTSGKVAFFTSFLLVINFSDVLPYVTQKNRVWWKLYESLSYQNLGGCDQTQYKQGCQYWYALSNVFK